MSCRPKGAEHGTSQTSNFLGHRRRAACATLSRRRSGRQVLSGCQKLHVIADNYQLLILSAPVVPARSAGKLWAFLLGFCIPARSARKLWAFYSVSDAKKANIFKSAFGAGLRPRPSATISYYLCNFWHPAVHHPSQCQLSCATAQTQTVRARAALCPLNDGGSSHAASGGLPCEANRHPAAEIKL